MVSAGILQTLYAALLTAGAPSVDSNHGGSTSSRLGSDTSNVVRPLVRTPWGDLRGVQKQTASGELIDSFLGIPFAMPPTGRLRFSPPVPTPKWTGVRDAVKFGNECVQFALPEYTYNISESPVHRTEDCLYLNIYRPVISNRSSSDSSLPVMVWVHGGGFVLGAGSQYEGSKIASKGVIVVTFNYRLDILGFLSNGDDVIPGNFGMLDQVRALEWVHFNIKSFGGDPGKVTVFGESAGSASVSLLALSPFAKGLFQRAIMESGASLSAWSVVQPTNGVRPSQITNLIGLAVGCTELDPLKKLECLRSIDAGALLNASLAVKNALGIYIHLPPVVETTYGFLPKYPERLLLENKFNHVDTIHGFNKAENGFQALTVTNYSMTKPQFMFLLKGALSPYTIIDREAYMESLYQDYVGNTTDGHKILMQSVNLLSDLNFRGPALLEAKMASAKAPEVNHYVYEFDHKPSTSPLPAWMPATHGDEIASVFGVNLKQFQIPGHAPTAKDQIVSEQIQTMWTNFAKTGNPTSSVPSGGVTWTKFDSNSERALRISDKSEMVDFSSHISQPVTQKLKSLLSLSIPDTFVG